jgi:2'-5' RNA ligase
LGDLDEVRYDRLLAELDQSKLPSRFTIEFGGLGAFPNSRRATVVWRGVERGTRELAALASEVETACVNAGNDPEDRPFRPHLTLSRVRPERDVGVLLDSELAPVRTPVSELTVFRSDLGSGSAKYERLDSISL